MNLRIATLAVALCSACASTDKSATRNWESIVTEPFGSTADGRAAHLFTLENANGIVVKLTDFGATVVELHVPDRGGELADIVLGFDEVAGYAGPDNQYFGCTTGRVANRIAKGRFTLDGTEYSLATNNDPNHLHGGESGFGQKLWTAGRFGTPRGRGLVFSYVSPAGEEGYPGELKVDVRYTLKDSDELMIEYRATTDAPTVVNLTNHSYFNLAGQGAETILDHELEIFAAAYTPTDDTLIPTGALEPVSGTPLDFRGPRAIGARVARLDDTPAIGYDHNYVLDGEAGELRPAARLYHAASGRLLELDTTEPGVQFYCGNFLNGATGKGGAVYAHRSALCLEPQHFPDSPNQDTFPSVVLRPGETYTQTSVFRFSVE